MRIADFNSGCSAATVFLVMLICLSVAGCLHGTGKAGQGTVPPPDSIAELTAKNKSLQTALSEKDDEILALEKDVADLNMKVLEYEAVIGDLQKRSDDHQQRLDEAIIEVVRTKARLRSLESKAEAASTIAEAEIAVSALKKEIPAADSIMREEILMAENLLSMSTREFKASNFGGALYLANQSKGQTRAVRVWLKGGSKKPPAGDEKRFVQPLPLVVLANSNLRSGPGIDNDVLATLTKGTSVTGHAYKGRWVRVETAEGVTGWLFRPLISTR